MDDLEPLDVAENAYREIAIRHIRTLLTLDLFMTKSADARLAWIAIAIAFRLNSVRNLSLAEIALQLGVTTRALSRSTAKIREMTGLDAGGLPVLTDQSTAPRL